MATPYKKTTPKPPPESTLVLSPRSDKRTFDMRPKPSDNPQWRRENPQERPSAHIDREPLKPLDPDPGE